VNGTDIDIAGLGTILSVWAHPDDETYLAGGLMAAAVDLGQRVVCASATAGERGTTDPSAWPPARLARVRRWEAAAAMAVLGVREHRVHGLPDGTLDQHHPEGRAWARTLIASVRPDTIVTFGADGYTLHPDHIAVHHWVTDASHASGLRCRLLHAVPTRERLAAFGSLYEEWGVYMTDARPEGVPASRSCRLALRGGELDRKVVALSAMATQTAALVTGVGPETFAALVAEETFVAAADA
jgi:LmbE family N-acetylglucosaminyl deacetylase